MTKLRISPDLALPPDVVTSTLVVYGGKGMGKTNLGSVLVEELTKAGLRWCLLDPMGVSWGLRYSADGTGPGIECVILGGAHGDIPIEPTGGAIVADLVVDENTNTIIDFSRKANGQMWTTGEKIRFVTEYTLRLFQRQGELVDGRRREPLMQILDEAARYIPQQIPSGAIDLAKCVGAWEQACEEGRNIGLGVAFLTQRSARMNKSVSELADVMFAFRTIGPNSLAAVMDWLGEHVEKSHVRELAAQVRELNVGQALVVSPGWLKVEKIATIRPRETFDSSSTPKPGQRAQKVTGAAAKPDLAKYHARMAATIERAKADDPKELRKQLATLRTELTKAQKAASGKTVDDEAVRVAVARATTAWTADMRAIDQKILDVLRAAQDQARSADAHLGNLIDQLSGVYNVIDGRGKLRENVVGARAGRATMPSSPPPMVPPRSTTRPTVAPRSNGNGNGTGAHADGVSGVEQRILNTLAGMEALGVDQPDKATVAALVGYHPNAKSYANATGSLRTSGRIEYPSGGRISLTDDGRAIAENSLPVSSIDELHELWFERLGNVARKILEPLLKAHPRAVPVAEVANSAGYHPNAKSFANMKGRLRTLGLIDYPSSGNMVATDVLFPEGLI